MRPWQRLCSLTASLEPSKLLSYTMPLNATWLLHVGIQQPFHVIPMDWLVLVVLLQDIQIQKPMKT